MTGGVSPDDGSFGRVLGLGQSPRTESYWTRTTLTDAETGRVAAEVLLHSGVFKESYPGYPLERIGKSRLS